MSVAVRNFRLKSYEDADRLVGNKFRVKACYGTYIVRRAWVDDEPIFDVELHGFGIVRYFHDGRIILDGGKRCTLESGNANGWWTPVTKKRINACLPDGFLVYQKKGRWFLRHPSITGISPRDVTPFHDGMNIGWLVNRAAEQATEQNKTGIANAVTCG